MEIRSYQKADYQSIYDLLEEAAWQSFIDTHQTAYKESLNASLTYVAIENDKVIGFIRAISDGLYLTFIGEIIVAKEYRRNKIGTRLIHFLKQKHPTIKYELISDEDMFYHKNGFKTVGTGQRSLNE